MRRGARPPAWTAPHQHPYQRAYWQPHAAFYPHQQAPGVAGPRWVGPPHPPAPAAAPAGRRGGCARAFLGCLAVVGIAAAIGVIVLVLVVAAIDEREATPREARVDPPPAATAPGVGPPTVPPPGVAPGAIPGPLGEVRDGEVDLAIHTGRCAADDAERDQPAYFLHWRGRGAAGKLRGKVALVHLKLTAHAATWTQQTSRGVTLSAAVAQAFLRAQGTRWSVGDLRIDSIVWPITTRYALPTPRLDERRRIDERSADELHEATRLAVETGTGMRLPAVVRELARRGYQEVAFLVHLPTGPLQVRDFARPSTASSDEAELAFLVAPRWGAPERGFIASHELLHLFGADDLYRKVRVAPEEQHEVMNAYCQGLARTSVEAATAYAVGWREAAPARPYRFAR